MFAVLALAVGSMLTNPQTTTGPWEQPMGLGGAVGFDIEIYAQAEGTPKSTSAMRQRVAQIWVTTYVRKFGRSQRTFWSTDYPAEFSWNGNHLVLNQPAGQGMPAWAGFDDSKAVQLDVVFDPHKSEWRGTLRNAWYSGEIDVFRPNAPHIGYPIIGDWLTAVPPETGFACKHIALGADSSLVIWSDLISLSGLAIYGTNGTKPPLSTPEWYGSLDMDPETKGLGRNTMFFTGSLMSGDIILADIGAAGKTFSGRTAHFGTGFSNDEFSPFTWYRASPDCSYALK